MYKYNAQIMPIKTKTVGQNDSKRARERKRNFKGNKRVYIIKIWYMISGSTSKWTGDSCEKVIKTFRTRDGRI